VLIVYIDQRNFQKFDALLTNNVTQAGTCFESGRWSR